MFKNVIESIRKKYILVQDAFVERVSYFRSVYYRRCHCILDSVIISLYSLHVMPHIRTPYICSTIEHLEAPV